MWAGTEVGRRRSGSADLTSVVWMQETASYSRHTGNRKRRLTDGRTCRRMMDGLSNRL